MTRHLFALFAPVALKAVAEQSVATITVFDEPLAHRIYRILRLNKDDSIILFDQFRVLHATLSDRPKKGLTLRIIQEEIISPPVYTLNVLLPLLKKDALDAAVYACIQAGARKVCLINTQRSHAIPKETKLLERLQKIAIAAAEQSKQFFFPMIVQEASLEKTLQILDTDTRLVADPKGDPLYTHLLPQPLGSVTITVGPEGGFSNHEKELLKKSLFRPCSLTTSILKSDQAIALLAYATSMALNS